MRQLFIGGPLRTGIGAIDEEHARLHQSAAAVDLAIAMGDSSSAIRPLFESYRTALADHFDAEERAMAEIGYPALERHRQEHQRLLDALAVFSESLDKGGRIDHSAYLRMDKILAEHVIAFDVPIRHFLDRKSNPDPSRP